MDLLKAFQAGLQKTKTALVRSIQGMFSGAGKWDDATYRRLEQALIAADLGVPVSTRLVRELRDRYERGLIATGEDIVQVCRERLLEILVRDGETPWRRNPGGPTVVLFVGVNGSGKTTSVAKLAHRLAGEGGSVLLGAADTFRAAGVVQLQVWAERLGCPVVGGRQGGDAAAVAFDAVKAGIQRRADYVLVDTAGRQHTRHDLMAELEKVRRTIGKAMPGAPHETWLTVDASTGSNALVQAREFGRAFPVTGLVLTKLDGTGKGGVVVAIRDELGYPVRFVGLGETADDLQPFSPSLFVDALFEPEPGG